MNHLRRLIAATALGLLVSGPAAATIQEMSFDGVWAAGSLSDATVAEVGDTYRATVRWDDAAPFDPNGTYDLTDFFSTIAGQLLFTPNVDGGLVLDSSSATVGVLGVLIGFDSGQVSSLVFAMGGDVGPIGAAIEFSAQTTAELTTFSYNPTPLTDPNNITQLTAQLTMDQHVISGPVTSVPEPTSVALVGLALAAFGFSRRRRV